MVMRLSALTRFGSCSEVPLVVMLELQLLHIRLRQRLLLSFGIFIGVSAALAPRPQYSRWLSHPRVLVLKFGAGILKVFIV